MIKPLIRKIIIVSAIAIVLANNSQNLTTLIQKAFATNETISCSGSSMSSPNPSITEANYTGDDVTFAYGGGASSTSMVYCRIDNNFNPNSITIKPGVTVIFTGSAGASVYSFNVTGNITIEDNTAGPVGRPGGRITHTDENVYGLTLSAGSLTIEGNGNTTVDTSDGAIDVEGRGCEGGGGTSGNGSGTNSQNGYGQSSPTGSCTVSTGGYGRGNDAGGGGGSYGGQGYSISSPYGTTYGSETNPNYLGSGGGRDDVYGNGGDGGGKIILTISGTAHIDGNILANGENGEADSGFAGGGGSGGTINLTASTISGSGNIKANGGNGVSWTHSSYGGGGGRIYLSYGTANNFPNTNITANPGTDYRSATPTAGSIMSKNTNLNIYKYYCQGSTTSPSHLTESAYSNVDNLSLADYNTESASDGWCSFDNTISLNTLNIESGVQLTHPDGDTDGVNVTTVSDITITGSINTDGRGCSGGDGSSGYGPSGGAGTCTTEGGGAGIFVSGSSFGGSGAGHGGAGGLDSGGSLASPGTTYGSESNPTLLGSGGSSGNFPNTGGDGGGRISLSTGGNLIINGQISANGNDGTNLSGYASGGGSGGSIYIDTNELSGVGSILAEGGNGGDGSTSDGGGGGGGRIAVYYLTDELNLDTQATVTAGTKGGNNGSATNGSAGTFYGLETTSLEFTTTTSSVSEGILAGTHSITVSANQNVIGNTSFDYTVTGGTATNGGTDYTLNAGTATIINGSNSTTIDIELTDDNIVENNETITILISNPTNGSILAENTNHTVTITDNDSAQINYTETDGSTTATEGSTTDSISFYLNSQPTHDVTVNLISGDHFTVNPTELTFTSANWNTPQAITITAVSDDIDKGTSITDELNFSSTSSDSNYELSTEDNEPIEINVNDDDTANIITTETDDNTIVSESGTTDTVEIVLGSEPTNNVIITLEPTSKLNIEPTELTFTNLNWNSAQTITIESTNDDIDQTDSYAQQISFEIASSDTNYNNFDLEPLSVTATDNDTSSINSIISGLNTQVHETETTSDTVNFSLATEPLNDVTITLDINESEVEIDSNELTFTSLNWDTPQTITITAIDDDLDENSSEIENLNYISSSLDPNYEALEGEISVIINDNDTAGITTNISDDDSIDLDETEENSDTISLVLSSEPEAEVTIAFTTDSSQYSIDESELIFTSENWQNPQILTITIVDDNIDEAIDSYTSEISYISNSEDTNYDGLEDDFEITITDNDTANISLIESEGSTTVSEAGLEDTIEFVLDSEPEANVIIAVTTNSQISVSTESLTFTNLNWNTPQQLIISAIDDNTYETEQIGTLEYAISSEDNNYDDFILDNNTITITENDAAPTVNNTNNDNNSNQVVGGGTSRTTNTKPETQRTLTIQSNETKIEFQDNTELKSNNGDTKIEILAPEIIKKEDIKNTIDPSSLKQNQEPQLAVDIKTNHEHVILNKEAKITIKIKQKIDRNKQLEVWYFNEKTKELEFISNKVKVSPNGENLSFETKHFSYFVIIENKNPPKNLFKILAPIWYKDAAYKLIALEKMSEQELISADQQGFISSDKFFDLLNQIFHLNNQLPDSLKSLDSSTKITREQALITINEIVKLQSLYKSKRIINSNHYFKDVADKAILQNALSLAIEHSYVSTNNEKFRPNDNITYSELISLISKLVQR